MSLIFIFPLESMHFPYFLIFHNTSQRVKKWYKLLLYKKAFFLLHFGRHLNSRQSNPIGELLFWSPNTQCPADDKLTEQNCEVEKQWLPF